MASVIAALEITLAHVSDDRCDVYPDRALELVETPKRGGPQILPLTNLGVRPNELTGREPPVFLCHT